MTALSTALGGLLSPEQINELATDLTAPPDYSWQGVASDMGGDAFEAARYQVEQFAANGDLLPQTFVPVINAQGETTMVRVDFISNIFSPDQFMITLDGVTYANPQELKDVGWYAVNDLKQVAVSDGAGNLITSVFVPDGNGDLSTNMRADQLLLVQVQQHEVQIVGLGHWVQQVSHVKQGN